MIAITQYAVPAEEQDAFAAEAARALQALAARPGYRSGSVGRATDDQRRWVLVTQWANVGSYRRALGSYDVKLRATGLLGRADNEATAFEELISASPGADPVRAASDLAEPR